MGAQVEERYWYPICEVREGLCSCAPPPPPPWRATRVHTSPRRRPQPASRDWELPWCGSYLTTSFLPRTFFQALYFLLVWHIEHCTHYNKIHLELMSISVLLLKNHEFIQICWVRRYIYKNLAYCWRSKFYIVHKILEFSRSGTYLAFVCKLYYTLLA